MGCKFRPIFRPVKMWAHQQKMKDPQYGIVFKLIKIEVEPSKNNNSLYQNYLSGDVFLDDEEEESTPKVAASKETVATKKSSSKQSKKVVEDSDSSDESDDSDSEEEVVTKKAAPKKGSRKGKAKKNSS